MAEGRGEEGRVAGGKREGERGEGRGEKGKGGKGGQRNEKWELRGRGGGKWIEGREKRESAD